jgi:hypothetical protein
MHLVTYCMHRSYRNLICSLARKSLQTGGLDLKILISKNLIRRSDLAATASARPLRRLVRGHYESFDLWNARSHVTRFGGWAVDICGNAPVEVMQANIIFKDGPFALKYYDGLCAFNFDADCLLSLRASTKTMLFSFSRSMRLNTDSTLANSAAV